MTDLSKIPMNDLLRMLKDAPAAADVAKQEPAATDLSHLSDDELGALAKAHGIDIPASRASATREPAMAFDAMGNPTGVQPDEMAPSQMPYGEQMRHAIGDPLRAVANGLPFMDRIAAGLGAATGLGGKFGDYSGNLAEQRRLDEEARQNAPVATLAGNLIGGALVPVGAIGAASKAAGLGSKMLAGAGAGAALGGLQGVSDSRDLTDLADTGKNAAVGLGVGAGLGATLPVVAKGIGAGVRAIAGRSATTPPGMGRPAAGKLAEALQADMPEAVQGKLATLGPEGMLLDAGPSLQGLGQGVALRPGEGRTVISTALRDRNAGANARLQRDIDEALGKAESPAVREQEIQAVRGAVTDPHYQQAFQQGQHWTPELEAISQRPGVKQALREAGDVASNEGRPLPTILLDEQGQQVTPAARAAASQFEQTARPTLDRAVSDLLGDGGQLATAGSIMQRRSAEAGPLYEAARAATIPDNAIPTDLLRRLKAAGALPQAIQKMRVQGEPFDIGRVQSWDYMKRALDDKIGAATRKGANDDARIYRDLKSELTQAVDAAVPAWARARQAYAGHSEMLSALTAGQNAFKSNVSREALSQEYSALTEGERAMYRLGAANALREKLAQAGDGANLAGVVSGNQALRDKLAVLAPDTAAADRFNAVLANSGREFQEATRPDVRGWKYALDALDKKAGAAEGNAAQGLGAARDALRGELNKIPAFARGSSEDAEYQQILDALASGGKLLDSGKGALRPGDLAAQLTGMSPAAREAYRIGARADIDRQIGTKANDLQALKQVIKGEGDWSRANLGQVFGQPAADKVIGSVDREAAFRDAVGKILENSQTAQRAASAKSLDQKSVLNHFAGETAWSDAKAALRRLLASAKADTSGRDAQLARALSAKGANRDQVFSALVDYMNRRGANARTAARAGDQGAAVLAALANAYGRQAMQGSR